MPASVFTPTTPTIGDLSIGRGIVFRGAYWDTTGALSLTHLGETQGDIVITPGDAIETLTTPELTGEAARLAYVKNGATTAVIPMFIGNPEDRALMSPTGNASGGYSRRRPVVYQTVAIFPEELLLNPTTGEYEALEKTAAGAFTVGGEALTADQTRLLGQTIWLWKVFPSRAPITLKDGEGGRSIEAITLTAVLDTTKPEGHMLYTIGDPTTAGIVIATA